MALLLEKMPQGVGALFGAVGLVAAYTDYRAGKIHNWLTFPALAAGLAIALYCGFDFFLASLAGVGVAAAIFIPLFFMGVMGAGDAKLVMALATVLGARGALELAAASVIVGGVAALVLLVRHRRVGAFAREIRKFLRSVFVPGLAVQWPKLDRSIQAPFGIAIVAGFILVWQGAI